MEYVFKSELGEFGLEIGELFKILARDILNNQKLTWKNSFSRVIFLISLFYLQLLLVEHYEYNV